MIIIIGPCWCHCHSLSLASVKSRLVVPFWYRLTRVVPLKGTLKLVCSETIVGVNKYRLDVQEDVEVLEIDNSKVRERQIARINKIRQARDSHKVCYLPLFSAPKSFHITCPVRSPRHTAPLIWFLISAFYVLFACLYRMLPDLSFFLHFVLTYLLPYLSVPLRTDPLCLQAGRRKRRLNLALVFFVL